MYKHKVCGDGYLWDIIYIGWAWYCKQQYDVRWKIRWTPGHSFHLPSPSSFWRHLTFNIPYITCEPSDIFLTCTWAVGNSFNLYVGLQGPGWLYALGIPPRVNLPLWPPRACATDLGQGPNVRAGSGRAPCVPRSRDHEERPAAGREKNAEGWKKHIYIYVQGSPSGCALKWNPGGNASWKRTRR